MSTDIAIRKPAELARVEVRALPFAVGFFFSFRLCIVLVSVRFLRLEPGTGTAVSIGLDLFLLWLACFDSIGSGHTTVPSPLRHPAVRWAFLFLFFAGISLRWSDTASLLNSFVYWLGLLTDVAIVAVLLRCNDPAECAGAMMRGFVWSSCILAVAAWVMPGPADLRLGDEQFFNTNEIGNLCAFGIFFAQYLTRSRRGSLDVAKLLLAITLVRSLSKTTLAAFLVSEACLLAMDRSMSRRMKILLISGVLLIALAFWGLFEAYYEVYTTAGNQAETFTGRIAIWIYAAGAAFDHPWTPWIGHGFDAWWNVVPPFGNEFFEARHAENEVLQQFYAFGLAGVILTAGIYSSLYRQLRKLTLGGTRIVFRSLLIFILIRGLAEADAFDLLLPLWSVVMISVLVDHEGAQKELFWTRRAGELNPLPMKAVSRA